MHEHKKLEEAEYFLGRMNDTRNDPTTFRQELSAFLSSARSVLQYANREARTRSEGQRWYDEAVASSPVITLMKRKRDMSIHREPVIPNNDATIRIQAGLATKGSLGLVHTNNQVQILEERKPDYSGGSEPAERSAVQVEYKYYFADAPGAGDILSLSRSYLAELHALVVDGRARGVITV